MKKNLILLFVFTIGKIAMAQLSPSADIATGGIEFKDISGVNTITSIPLNGKAKLKVGIINIGEVGSAPIAVNQITAVIQFPVMPGATYEYVDLPNFTSAFFTWTYDNVDRILVGQNHVPIPRLGFEEFLVEVQGILPTTGPPNATSLNLTTAASTGNLLTANDYGLATISVTLPALSTNLVSFEGLAENCATKIKWTTENEENMDRFELEHSKDGINFALVHKLPAKNTAQQSTYIVNYNQPGMTGIYRLKIVAKDGSVGYSNVIKVKNDCKAPKIKLYPNPVTTGTVPTLHLENFANKITGRLVDAQGKIVRAYIFNNGFNRVQVADLPAGQYILEVIDEDQNQKTVQITLSR